MAVLQRHFSVIVCEQPLEAIMWSLLSDLWRETRYLHFSSISYVSHPEFV